MGERKEDGGSPSGGGEELVIVDGLAWIASRKISWVTSQEMSEEDGLTPPLNHPLVHL
jgi:hypothetical protein